jgi:predicted nucleic acid-binding protein
MSFVLDNSGVTGWYLPGQANAYTQAIAERLEADRVLVPAIWQLELANVLKTACTRGKLSIAAARKILDVLSTLPIEVDSSPAPGQRQMLELAMRHNLSSYDAAYLDLAVRLGLPIATQDAEPKAAAQTADIEVL